VNLQLFYPFQKRTKLERENVECIHLNHLTGNKAVGVMKAGQTFTIEPMINAGMLTHPKIA